MSEEEFNDVDAELEDDDLEDDDIEDEEIDDDLELDLDDDLAADTEEVDEADTIEEEVGVEPVPNVATAAEPRSEDDEDEDALDLDEELHPDDVEAPLDALLQERTASAKLEDEEEELEEEEVDGDDRADGPTRIVPRRPDEFLCQSCFLLLPLRRLADPQRQYCDDCA